MKKQTSGEEGEEKSGLQSEELIRKGRQTGGPPKKGLKRGQKRGAFELWGQGVIRKA